MNNIQPTDIAATLGKWSARRKWGVVALALVFGWGLFAYARQLWFGLVVTAMTDYFSWGIYIVTFVFFIGISMAGTVISAVLRLTKAEWRHPITRMAEGITVFALVVAGLMIIVDMGRPDRLWYLIRYGRVQSPLLWDVFSLTTYLAGSLLYLWLPMIPDLAMLRDRAETSPWRKRLYTQLAMGWRGSPEQQRRLERAITVMALTIIPVAVSIHTITAWIFGMTLREGWHSTIIGPDFVVGALYSGTAAVITAMALLRYLFHLENYLTLEHFKKLGLLLLTLCVVYFYFTVNEYIAAGYTNEHAEQRLLDAIFHGPYATQFWWMIIAGMMLPALLLALPWTRNLAGIITASLLVNLGMWLKRYVLVVPTLHVPFLPPDLADGKTLNYIPTWVEWSIVVGGFALFLLLFALFAKVFPLISTWETTKTARVSSGTLALVIFLGAVTPVNAQELTITTTVEDGKKMIVATVTKEAKPVAGARVAFSVQRTFGRLALGEEETLDDGTAAVLFPEGLPSDPDGKLKVFAEVKSPANLAVVRGEVALPGGAPRVVETNPFPRALWSPRAPLGLLLTVGVLVGGVWCIYGYVVAQVFAIRKEPIHDKPLS